MSWALAVAIVWALLAMPAGYLLGRRALRADRRDQPAPAPAPAPAPPPARPAETTTAAMSDVSGAGQPSA
jgi:hypothetical protein